MWSVVLSLWNVVGALRGVLYEVCGVCGVLWNFHRNKFSSSFLPGLCRLCKSSYPIVGK